MADRDEPDNRSLPTAPQTVTLRRRPIELLPHDEHARLALLGASRSQQIPVETRKNPAAEIKQQAQARHESQVALVPVKAQARRAALSKSSEWRAVSPQDGLGASRGRASLSMIGRFLLRVSGARSASAAAVFSGADKGRPSQDEDALDAISGSTLLQEVPDVELIRSLATGQLRLSRCGRDVLIEQPQRVLLILTGQLAVAELDPAWLDEKRRQLSQHAEEKPDAKAAYKRQLAEGPLIAKPERNLAALSAGDLIDLEEVWNTPPFPSLYTVTPANVLSISRELVTTWSRHYPSFAAAYRTAGTATRQRIAKSAGEHGAVADFFIRNGKSIATTMRVRDLDKCIECYACEKACEDRYGAQRLFLNGKVLGTMDFVNTCQTCTDQRCVEVCGYNAIGWSAEKGEVLINEANCTGCTMCARACPYDAITMYALDEAPLLKARLERELPPGPRARKLASKCDHCINYPDQACITACPTEALLEVAPPSLFSAEPGTSSLDDSFGPFVGRLPLTVAKLRPQRFMRLVRRPLLTSVWVLWLLALVACTVEVALRIYRPGDSAQYSYLVRALGVPPAVALQDVVYRPTSGLGLWLGRVGALLLLSTFLYSFGARTRLAQRLPFLRDVTQHMLFDMHVLAGCIGSGFLLLHSAGNLRPQLSRIESDTALAPITAMWMLFVVVCSGFIGRYLATLPPALARQASLLARELKEDLAHLRNNHAGVLAADLFFERLSKGYLALVGTADRPRRGAALLCLLYPPYQLLIYPFQALRLYFALDGIKDRRARRQVTALVLRLAALNRDEVFAPRVAPLVKHWRVAHVPLAIILSVVALGHVLFEELRQDARSVYGAEPGPRATAHRDIVRCEACHVTQHLLSDDLCLRCHAPIARQLFAGRGMHDLFVKQPLACYRCHREHRGAGHDLLGFAALGGSGFDHALTGFALRGRHAVIAKDCQRCHPGAPRSFIDAHASRCATASCHGKDDVHEGQLGARCERCHVETAPFAQTTFSHNDPRESERWKLVGKHSQVRCASCHPKTQAARGPAYKSAPRICEGCHDDAHRGRYRQYSCSDCHTPAGWRDIL